MTAAAGVEVRRRLRIGVVTTSYPRFAGDPAGSFVKAHADAMRALGHRVEVVGAHTIESSLFRGAGAPEALERGRGHVRGALFVARLAAEVRRRAHAWDAIVAHWLVPAAAAAVAVRPARKPLLAIAHGGDVHTLRRLHLLRPTLRLLRGARLAFVSDELRALADVPDALVQPMGIDVAHFASLARAPASTPTILVVARLVPVKGVDVAIAALPRVRAGQPDAATARASRPGDARLVIAGDGPERARLAQLAAELGVADRVTFLGTVDAAARDELLRRATVVVVPSRVLPNGRSEGMPMIAVEALAAGVPVVASAVGGLATLRAAVRARPDDAIALAAAIDRALAAPPNNDELRASVSHLDWPTVATRLLDDLQCEVRDTNDRRSA